MYRRPGDRRSPLRARLAPPSSPRTQKNPAPGGQLTPWKHVTPSSSLASTTCRYVQPSPCMSLARSAPFGAHMLLTSQSSPLDCPCPCAQDFDWLRRLLSQEVRMGAVGVGASARGAGSTASGDVDLFGRRMRLLHGLRHTSYDRLRRFRRLVLRAGSGCI